jgi:hypothetical protein
MRTTLASLLVAGLLCISGSVAGAAKHSSLIAIGTPPARPLIQLAIGTPPARPLAHYA